MSKVRTRNTSGVLKIAKVKGNYFKTIKVDGLHSDTKYYCVTIMCFRSYNSYSAYVNACHAIDNTNNHYGVGVEHKTLIGAISKALLDANIITEHKLTENSLNIELIRIAKKLNPEIKQFEVIYGE